MIPRAPGGPAFPIAPFNTKNIINASSILKKLQNNIHFSMSLSNISTMEYNILCESLRLSKMNNPGLS